MGPKQPKRSKAEIAAELERSQKVEHSKVLARLIFPAVEQLGTVYDGQTAFNAVAGHIKYGLQMKENTLKISDLEFDLEKGAESDVKAAVRNIIELLRDEPASDAYRLLDTMGSKLLEFVANKHLKDPMNTVTSEEFIAG